MVRKKSNYKKYARRAMSTAQTAQTALKVARGVASLLNVEHHPFDVNGTQGNISWNGYVTNLVFPAQGDAFNERDGDSIKVESLLSRLRLEANNADKETLFRIMLVVDRQNTLTAWDDILHTSGTAHNNVLAPRSVASTGQYRVVYDKVFKLDAGDTLKYVKIWKKFKNLHVKFSAGSVSILHNALKFVFLTDADPTGGTMPYISHQTRTRYLDN